MKFSRGLIFSLALHMAIFAFALILASAGIHGLVRRDYKMVLLVSEEREKKAQATRENGGHTDRNSSDNLTKKHVADPVEKPTAKRKTFPPLPLSRSRTDNQQQISETKAPSLFVPESPGFSVESVAVGGFAERGVPIRRDLSSSPGDGRTDKKVSGGDAEVKAGGNSGADAIGKIRAAIEKALVYPALAKRRGMEGTVTVQFKVNSSGIPGGVRVIRNSGFTILDSAAKESVLNAGPLPLLNGEIEIPITFRLNKQQ